MKVIKIKTQDTITSDQVTSDHIVILKFNEDWCILMPTGSFSKNHYAHCLFCNFTKGNRYCSGQSIQEWLSSEATSEAHAFNTMQEAAKFISELN